MRLHDVRTIIVHDNCADGLASAILLHDALPDTEVRFVQYGTAEHVALRAAPGMLFCDFSPHPDTAAEHAAAGTIVLDHHRTAKPIVLAMGKNGVYGDEAAEPGVSGAVLAYRHVWRPLLGASDLDDFAEDFAMLAGVRDTWQTKHERWGEACALAHVLHIFNRSCWLDRGLRHFAERWDSQLLVYGCALKSKEEERVRRAIDGGYRFTTGDGRRVLVVQGVSVTSDGAELLGESVDLVVGFSYGVENEVPKVKFSLRSHTGVDCAAIAKAHGGGGHTAAAGFSRVVERDDPQPYRLFEGLLGEAN